MCGRPTSRFEPYKMAWVMIDLISVARPVLVHSPSEHVCSIQLQKTLLSIEFRDLVHIDVHLHHCCGGEDEQLSTCRRQHTQTKRPVCRIAEFQAVHILRIYVGLVDEVKDSGT